MPVLSNRWTVLALMCLARTSMAMQFQSIPPITQHLMADLGLNYTQIGTLIGLYMVAGIFLALPAGLLGNRFGDKRVVLSGLAMMTLGSVLFTWSQSFELAFVARLLGGVGVVLLNVLLTKIITDWFAGKEIATAMGFMVTTWPFGIALSLSNLGWVAEATNWQTAILVTAGFSGLALLGIALFYKNPEKTPNAGSGELSPRLWVIQRMELVLILVAGFVWMLPNTGFIILFSFAPALLISKGLAPTLAGMTVSIVSWISIASMPLGGLLADRLKRINFFILFGLSMSAVVLWLLPVGGSPIIWMVLLGLISGTWPGQVMTLPGKALSPQSRATGFGIFYSIYYLGMASLPPIGGWLVDTTGSASVPMAFGGGLFIAGIAALLLFRMLFHKYSATS